MHEHRSNSSRGLLSVGPVQRYRRKEPSRLGDWRVLRVLLGLLIVVAAGTWISSLTGQPARLIAGVGGGKQTAQVLSAAALPEVAAAVQPSHPRPAPVGGLYSWDYRWHAVHGQAGAPGNRSQSYLMVDLSTRRVLASLKPHQRMPMASTAKLMTAMVALDSATPDTTLTVPAIATQVEPDVMGLSVGEKVQIGDLLYGLLLDSGNDAAETLARMTLGRDAFIRALNDKARQLGLMDTHFANPSGLDDPGEYSSAHDLAIVAAYLHDNYPLLNQVVTTRSINIYGNSDHKAFVPENFNHLLWSYAGSLGFKTGLTDDAGDCLVTGAQRGGRALIVVELNDPLIFTDAAAMMDYGFRRSV